MSGHRKGRKRAIPRVRADGKWYGYGPEVEDAISGWLFPKQWMVRSCGGLVSRFFQDGSFDLEDGRLDRGCPGGRTAPPLITIVATTDTAVEGGATGLFTLTRTGDTSEALTVPLVISGTAVNGTDYTLIASTITFSAGQSSTTITVTATDDGSAEDEETVIVTIDPPVHNRDYRTEAGTDTATVTISASEDGGDVVFLVYEFESGDFLGDTGSDGTFDLEEEILSPN